MKDLKAKWKQYLFFILLFSAFGVCIAAIEVTQIPLEKEITLLISMGSFMLAAYSIKISQASLQRSVEHDIRSVTPHLQSWIEMGHSDNEITVSLRNCGIGPACIRTIKANGSDSESIYTQAVVTISRLLGDTTLAENIVHGITTNLAGCLVPANEEIALLLLRFNDIPNVKRLEIMQYLSEYTIHVDYVDIYEIDCIYSHNPVHEQVEPTRPYVFEKNLADLKTLAAAYTYEIEE